MSIETHNAKLLCHEGWVCRRVSDMWASKGTREKYAYHYHRAGADRALCGVLVVMERRTDSTAIALPSSKPKDDEPCKRCLALLESVKEVANG